MARLFKNPDQLSQYRDRRFLGSQDEFENALRTSTTVYVGNLSFYTTEEQIYEVFSRTGELKKITMGLDKNTKTPCGFCFVLFYTREDTEDAVKYISGTILDDRPIRVDFDWGFQEGRQWGRGRSGGQVRDEYRTDYDPGRGGYGKLVQKELEVRRQLVEYEQPVGMGGVQYPGLGDGGGGGGGGNEFRQRKPRIKTVRLVLKDYEAEHQHVKLIDDGTDVGFGKLTGGRDRHGHGGNRNREGRKRYRDEDAPPADGVKRQEREPKVEKNPRFREKGDSDEEDGGDGGKS